MGLKIEGVMNIYIKIVNKIKYNFQSMVLQFFDYTISFLVLSVPWVDLLQVFLNS